MSEEVGGTTPSFVSEFASMLTGAAGGTQATETASAQSTEAVETKVESESESTEVADTQENPAAEGEQNPIPREVEYSFTDKDGKKQKAKFDLNDTAKLQQQLSLAAGARLWQFERDKARKELDELKTKHSKVSESYTTLEQAWGDGGSEGLKGLVNLLAGSQDGFDKLIKAEVERLRQWESATPDEQERMRLLEEKEAAVREREKAIKTLNQREEAAKKAQEEARLASTRAIVDPVFFKYSFDGKLGDPEVEAELNETLWTSATKKLDALPEGTELTPALVEEVFSKVASRFKIAVDKQADSKTKEVLSKKKEQAQTKVAAAAKSGLGTSSKDLDVEKSLGERGFASTLAKLLGG